MLNNTSVCSSSSALGIYTGIKKQLRMSGMQ